MTWATLTTTGEFATHDTAPSLRDLQYAVGGFIEAFYLDDGVVMMLNEEGKIGSGNPDLNLVADAIAHAFGTGLMMDGDHIVGDVCFVGPEDDNGALVPLTQSQISRLMQMVAACGGRRIDPRQSDR
jgi:hypothetical protein